MVTSYHLCFANSSESIFSYNLVTFCRKVAIVNLDPANDALPYPFSYVKLLKMVEIGE